MNHRQQLIQELEINRRSNIPGNSDKSIPRHQFPRNYPDKYHGKIRLFTERFHRSKSRYGRGENRTQDY